MTGTRTMQQATGKQTTAEHRLPLLPHTGLFFLLCLLALPQANAQTWEHQQRGAWVSNGAGLVLTDKAILADIIVSANAPSGVKQAAQFLASDIETITGQRPNILAQPRNSAVSIRLATQGLDNIPAELGAETLAGKWEAYRIKTLGNVVWLIGSNPRGTAFAAYTFSERIGIDPLYHWTGYSPDQQTKLVVKAIDFEANEPTFKYRGLFHDDEDILPAPLDKNGYPQYAGGTVPPEWYKRYFETALRLRMNQVAPFVRATRPFVIQQMANDWGLIYSSHHYDILLSNPFGYDRFGLAKQRGISGNYDWSSNRDGIFDYWRAGVEENKDLATIWPVGLRGTADTAYQFPQGTTQAQKNKVFTDAIHQQVTMTKSLLAKDAEPVFHFTLYGEMLQNYLQTYDSGTFDFPEDVILVWNDTGDGIMRALPKDLGKWKHGVYYHLAYYGATTKQTHHTIRPDRIASQFRKIVDSGATEYLLLNVSELREHVMNTRFIAEISWDATNALAPSNAADRFVDWWTAEYFGKAAAGKASEVYRHYFDILHAHDQIMYGAKKLDKALQKLSFRLKGDHHVHYEVADLTELDSLQKRLTGYETALATAWRAMGRMNTQQSRFFFENVALGLLMDYHPTKAAALLNKSLRQYPDEAALKQAELALQTLEQLEHALSAAERPPFDHWYRPTWIRRKDSWTNPHYSYERLKHYLESYEPRYK